MKMARKSGREKDIEAGMPADLVATREAERKAKKKLTPFRTGMVSPKGKTKPKGSKRSAPATDAEKAKVIKLRKAGTPYIKIETAMNWHDCSGVRAWRICKLAGLVGK
jgi:hypothetical protein